MILQYVIKNIRRRKIRTLVMVLALIVSMGLIVAMSATVETVRRSNVDLVATATGRYDLSVRHTNISSDPFVTIDDTREQILAADDRITAVYPRFQSSAELRVGDHESASTLIALDPDEGIGIMTVVSGTYTLGDGQVALLSGSALNLGNPEPGDTIEIAYSFPLQREKGSVASVESSQRRAVGLFTISGIVRQNGVAGGLDSGGVFMHIEDAQKFLNLEGQAEELIGLVEPSLYDAPNSEDAALNVREVAENVQAALGDDYDYGMSKASYLDGLSQAFLMMQALISTYSLISLGVVGLLVYTLIMTNVQEQRREMAILRILGGQRKTLFGIVIVEVAIIGVTGVILGVLLGQAITNYAIIPGIEYMLSRSGLIMTIKPAVSLRAILPAILSATVVLSISAARPAQDASKTKILHAINPGVADNIQLEDLDELRERRPNMKLLFIGIGLLMFVVMIFALMLADTFGDPTLLASIILAVMLLMIMGLVFIFFIFTRPLERLILYISGLFAPRLVFFAQRNVGRSSDRNTLFSILVLFSAVLPSFLATSSAIDTANIETDIKLSFGAPIDIRSRARLSDPEFAALYRLRPSILEDALTQEIGIENKVGFTYGYESEVSDVVGLRSGTMELTGVTGDLNDVLYKDMMVFTDGGPESLTEILSDPYAVVISQGMAEGLAIPLGGIIKVQAEGIDHYEELRVAGVAQRLPGLSGIERIRNQALNGGTVLISMDGFRRVTTDPDMALPDENEPVLNRILATIVAGVEPKTVQTDLHELFNREYDDYSIISILADVQLESSREQRLQSQVFLLVMTLISFITAVFGVFAVIYVTIFARRKEIGMMKAVGVVNWEMNGMLSLESIAMSLSAALAGIIAGAVMAYSFATVNNLTAQRPQHFAIDTTVMPFIIILVVVASVVGTIFSARRIIKHRAIEILRMS